MKTAALAVLVLATHSAVEGFTTAANPGSRLVSWLARPAASPDGTGDAAAAAETEGSEWQRDLSPQQQKSWAFLKGKGLVGFGQKASGFTTTGKGNSKPQSTEEENYRFAEDQGKRITEEIQEAIRAYGEEEKAEKRELKQRVLAGEELDWMERARLEDLKERNKAKREAEQKLAGPLMKKTALAFAPCNVSGVIDDMTETYPVAKCGTEWTKSTDQVMGGVSRGEVFATTITDASGVERKCLLLKGQVSTAYNGGFIQMALDLSNSIPPGTPVDASAFDGLEMDVYCPRGESYNTHLRTPDCLSFPSSYRATFDTTAREWTTVRVLWSDFEGSGPGAEERPLDTTSLRRLGLLGFGRDFDAELAVAGVRFFKEGE